MVDFLECLGEAELTEIQRSSRDSLLTRSRAVLVVQQQRAPDSPEPYLDMSAGGGKSAMLLAADGDGVTERRPQEYVGVDGRQAQVHL